MEDGYFGIRRLSKYSDISVRLLRDYIKTMPHYRINGKILVRQSDFDLWMQRYRKEPEDLNEIVDEITQGVNLKKRHPDTWDKSPDLRERERISKP